MPHTTRRLASSAIAALITVGCAAGGPSASPTPSTESSQSAPTATATPSFNETALFGAFLAITQDPARSFHLVEEGEVAAAGFEGTFSAEYDIRGGDLKGVIRVRFGADIEQQVMLVDGQGFTLTPAGTWTLADAPVTNPDPFGGLTAADLEYAGPTSGSEDAHRINVVAQAAALRALSPAGGEAFKGVEIGTASFDVVVAADGAPVQASVELEGTLTGEMAGELHASLAYTFSGWGQDVAIKAPYEVATFPPDTAFVADNRYDETVIWRDTAGNELVVEGCGRGWTSAFDGREFVVVYASDGAQIDQVVPAAPPDPVITWKYGIVSSLTTGVSGDVPVGQELPPCTARPA